MRLADYMFAKFPGLQLGPNLFYKWPIGIRFELGTNQTGMRYEEVVLHRSVMLYEAAFDSGDLSWIVSATTQAFRRRGTMKATGERYRTFCPTIFQLRRPHIAGLGGPAGRIRFVSSDKGETPEITTLRWAGIQPRKIDYQRILQAKANADYHLRRPRTCDRVFFVNRTRNLVLHMYDDRGLDLIAAKRSDIQMIYDKYGSWALDYDRAQIEKVFERSN